MSYYEGNAAYKALENPSYNGNFRWAVGDSWLLTYGNSACEPKLLIHARAVAGNPTTDAPGEQDTEMLRILAVLSRPLSIPVAQLRFDVTSDLMNVAFGILPHAPALTSMEELARIYREQALPISYGPTDKPINVHSSSAYHLWQRDTLGRALVATDIDLVRVRGDVPVELIELNRSEDPLDTWVPYRDSRKFRLAWNVANANKLPFTISYNYRKKYPFFDDISRVSLFHMDFGAQGTPYTRLGVHPFDYFARGDYLA